MILSQIKDNALLCFSLSLITSYFACCGYYAYFHLDVASFLSIEDLTIVYARWIWLSGLSVIAALGLIYSFFEKMGSGEGWWDKTLGRSQYKRRILVVLPVITSLIALFVYKKFADVLAMITGLSFALAIITILLVLLISVVKNKGNLSEISLKDWPFIISISYLFVFVMPFYGGTIAAEKSAVNTIVVKFDDDSLFKSSDSTDLVYVGKTFNYFFINNVKTKTTTAYRMDRVKSFEIIPEHEN